MKQLLITNGCSFTWGDELPAREFQAYPYLLAKKLGVGVVNLAECGRSNEAIIRTTLDYIINKDLSEFEPIFVIGWSGIARKEFYSQGQWQKITPTQVVINKLAEVHYKYLQSEKQDNLEFFNQVLLLQLLFKSKNFKYFFFNINDGQVFQKIKRGSGEVTDGYNLNHLNDNFFDELDLNLFPSFTDSSSTFMNYALANGGELKPGRHPDEKSHEVWADYIATKINL